MFNAFGGQFVRGLMTGSIGCWLSEWTSVGWVGKAFLNLKNAFFIVITDCVENDWYIL